MEFDINRVYTAVNADLVKPGSKVLVADDLETLRYVVKEDHDLDTLTVVNSEDYGNRFNIDGVSYMLAYLVSEPKEPRRMTNRELARWLAQGNGQWKGTNTIGIAYSYSMYDDHEIPDSVMIRGWDEAEWREPTVEEADE